LQAIEFKTIKASETKFLISKSRHLELWPCALMSKDAKQMLFNDFDIVSMRLFQVADV
jgi:hypothetical protein